MVEGKGGTERKREGGRGEGQTREKLYITTPDQPPHGGVTGSSSSSGGGGSGVVAVAIAMVVAAVAILVTVLMVVVLVLVGVRKS